MESSPLPTPRHILTSIINTLTSTPIPPPTNEEELTGSPLRFLASSHRALLATLHVLIPPPTLLQALDLLDRRLVTRITPILPGPRDTRHDLLSTTTPVPGELRSEAQRNNVEVLPDITGTHPMGEEEKLQLHPLIHTTRRGAYPAQTIYRVQSSVPPKSRFGSTASTMTGTRVYTVHLEAWNCDCAAFAFAAFPASRETLPFNPEDDPDSDDGTGDFLAKEDDERVWEFGGLSLDGRGADQQGVPCCKHLLACVLAERWGSVLGGFVNCRDASLEEMAGLIVGE
ncbi:hypothetical protein F5884DRAFT_51971 [Xylogone sp. PMI_703]|nr:hypothetical protein F5884DRAFT_51971 [Xylogone sp. PMI_703]